MPNKTLDLTKIKLGKRVVLTYTDFVMVGDDAYTKEVTEKCQAPPTAEFKAAVRKLNDYVYKLHPLEAKNVESLSVNQITMKPEDDGMGITLSVTAQFKNVSRPSNFNTPYVSTLDNSNPMPDDIVEIIDVIKDQAKLYSEGVYEQATLDLDALDVDSTELDDGKVKDDGDPKQVLNENGTTEKPKRGRKNELKKAKEDAENQEAEEAEA